MNIFPIQPLNRPFKKNQAPTYDQEKRAQVVMINQTLSMNDEIPKNFQEMEFKISNHGNEKLSYT